MLPLTDGSLKNLRLQMGEENTYSDVIDYVNNHNFSKDDKPHEIIKYYIGDYELVPDKNGRIFNDIKY